MSQPPLRFIVVDGPDGTGKTTLVRGLANRLIEAGRPAVPARNPAGTQLGAAIRKATIEVSPGEEPSPLAQFYAQVAATTQLVREQLVPNIQDGFVIFDRYLLSLAIYQGLIPKSYLPEFLPRYSQCTAHLPVPGFTVVLRASPEVIMSRIAARNLSIAPVKGVVKGKGKKAPEPPKDVMETEARVNAQVHGFEIFECFMPPHSSYLGLDTDTRSEEQVLDVVWSAVQKIWQQDFAYAGDSNLQKSRNAVSKF